MRFDMSYYELRGNVPNHHHPMWADKDVFPDTPFLKDIPIRSGSTVTISGYLLREPEDIDIFPSNSCSLSNNDCQVTFGCPSIDDAYDMFNNLRDWIVDPAEAKPSHQCHCPAEQFYFNGIGCTCGGV